MLSRVFFLEFRKEARKRKSFFSLFSLFFLLSLSSLLSQKFFFANCKKKQRLLLFLFSLFQYTFSFDTLHTHPIDRASIQHTIASSAMYIFKRILSLSFRFRLEFFREFEDYYIFLYIRSKHCICIACMQLVLKIEQHNWLNLSNLVKFV